MSYAGFGLFWASFLSATVLPGASEGVFLYQLKQGLHPAAALFWATSGNVLGGLSCYAIGLFGYSRRWESALGIPRAKVLAFEAKANRWGPALALFAWLPVVGDPLAVALGLFGVPWRMVVVYMSVGKFLRYAFLAGVYFAVFEL